jgi:arylsulfatase A-like enzyme
MNIVLLVVDSLRAQSLDAEGGPRTPFLQRLGTECVTFREAYATECWTLPTHCSLFTGLLPSEHGAHFHSMAYSQAAPTIAELLARAGYHTEIVTRNFAFDGTIPGITRGFRTHTRLLADAGALNPFAIFLALAKPRFRRHVRRTGFFHPLQRENRQFLTTFARSLMPADQRNLDHLLEQMQRLQRRREPYFIFSNLYDVHAPYPPTARSILRPFRSWRGTVENLTFPYFISYLGEHTYLRPDFHVSERGRRMLLGRYHSAIELMDAKLQDFYEAARRSGLLDDTLLIVTSDHGEAFGEHNLYLHDASVYNTHLHVPLWIHHPARPPAVVHDVVSTRDVFGLMRAVGLDGEWRGTLLDADYRAAHPVALAEHFHYPHLANMAPRYRQNIVAAITATQKVIVRADGVEHYDLGRDAAEVAPEVAPLTEFAAACRRAGLAGSAIMGAVAHLEEWRVRQSGWRAAS